MSDEWGRGLEVTALAAFAFSRPVLDSFGRSPETFIARQATTTDIVLFGLVVAFLPALVVVGAGIVARFFGPVARERVHLGLVGLLAAVGAWRLGRDLTGWPNDARKLLLAGLLVGLVVGMVRWRVPSAATFLRYAGGASVVFLLQFLLLSPTADLAFGGSPGVDPEVTRQVAAELDDDPPSIVVLVLDELPTASLLDGAGRVDAELFPNIGKLASTSTWYRNHTTVAAFTAQAVPAILTGRNPEDGAPPRRAASENLFTLLGGLYDRHVREEVTRLCPGEICPRDASDGVGSLLDEAVTWWQGEDPDEAVEFDLGTGLDVDRYRRAETGIEQLDLRTSARPDLIVHHVLLPHVPHQFLDDGSLYAMKPLSVGAWPFGWGRAGADVGRQRHILQAQAADRLVGRLLGRLRAEGAFDDSLIVVTADHGVAFQPERPNRYVTADTIPDVLWSPLFIKAPGQTGAKVDDSNVMSIDVVPTIADHLGITIPWEVDGLPVGSPRDPHRKLVSDSELHDVHAADGEQMIEVDAREHFDKVLASDPVTATGQDAVWRRTEHGDLFGRDVADLRIGEPVGAELQLTEPGDLGSIDIDAPLPLEMIGYAHLEIGTPVALALNGTIGAATTVEPYDADGDAGWLVHGLVPPRLFEDGANELTAYVVEGPPGAETLRPLAVA